MQTILSTFFIWPLKFSATTSPIRRSHYNQLTEGTGGLSKRNLLELKPNIRKMWATGGELTNLFESQASCYRDGLAAEYRRSGRARKRLAGETIPGRKTLPAGSIT